MRDTTAKTFKAKTDMFEKQINSFIDCIHSGNESPADIKTAIVSQKILDAYYQSAEKNEEVRDFNINR